MYLSGIMAKEPAERQESWHWCILCIISVGTISAMNILDRIYLWTCVFLVSHASIIIISAVRIPGMREETEVQGGDTQIELTEESPLPVELTQSSPLPDDNEGFAAVARIRDGTKKFGSVEDDRDVGGEVETSDERKSQRKGEKVKGKGKVLSSGECGRRHMTYHGGSSGRKQAVGKKNHDRFNRRGGKKGGDNRGIPEQAGRPYPGGGGREAFNILTMGASQMMRQWMTEAKRRYPEDFGKLVTEWSNIMTEFDNISFPDTENNTALGNQMEGSDVITKEFVTYDSEMGSLPDYFKNARYSVMCSSPSGYEVRKYETTLWINTIVNTSSYDFAGMIAFKRLFEYTQGKNSLGIQIPMTIPLRKQIKSPRGWIAPVSLLRDESFLVSLYLPDEYIDSLPEPLDHELFLEHSNLYAYAFNFSGWAYGLNVYQKYFESRNTLVENNEPVVQGEFYMQMYDSPWVINAAERHNELLIPVGCTNEDFLSCPSQQPDPLWNHLGSNPEAIIKIRTISTRREVSLQLLLSGVFLTQRSDLSLNLTDIVYGSELGCFSKIHPLLQTIYTTNDLPYFLKLIPSTSTPVCSTCYQSYYYIPKDIYDQVVQPSISIEGSSSFDRVNPTLYFVMNLAKVPKLNGDDILERYQRMRVILQSRGYCFSQDEFLVAYRRDQQSLSNLEMFIPADLHCSDVQ